MRQTAHTEVVGSSFPILFTSAGRRVALVRLFREALDSLGLSGPIIAADLKLAASAMWVADERVLVPRATEPAYVPALLDICEKRHVRLLVPLIDTELHVLAPHRAEFARIGTELLVCGPETSALCFDKRRTHDFFVRSGADTPAFVDLEAPFRGPVFLKPADGSCSVGAHRIDSAEALAFYARSVPNAIVQELVVGDEYTFDVLVDFEGRVRCVVPRLRMETRAGEISKGRTVKRKDLVDRVAAVVAQLPDARGCVTVQAIETRTGRLAFIEINPRFGGGFPLAAAAGADFPKAIVQWCQGREVELELDGFSDGRVMLRYDDAIFLDAADLT